MNVGAVFVCVAAGALLAGCGSKTSGSTESSSSATAAKSAKVIDEAHLAELTVDEVDKRLASNDATFHVYDANNQDVFLTGHVPSAKWVPFSEVKPSMLPENKGDTLVFYCANEH